MLTSFSIFSHTFSDFSGQVERVVFSHTFKDRFKDHGFGRTIQMLQNGLNSDAVLFQNSFIVSRVIPVTSKAI
ncbi:hypothetical protein D3C71_1109670 [compost metagenome]